LGTDGKFPGMWCTQPARSNFLSPCVRTLTVATLAPHQRKRYSLCCTGSDRETSILARAMTLDYIVSLGQTDSPVFPRDISANSQDLSFDVAPAQFQPFVHIAPVKSPRINTSKKFSIFYISLIMSHFNCTRINTSGNKDLKSPRINTSGSKDLKSFRINTSKKHHRGPSHAKNEEKS
jgi:hypothetical protein